MRRRCWIGDSADCFSLLTAKTMFVWRGGGSNETERATAEKIAGVLRASGGKDREVVTLDEGSEPAAFWDALGGKGEYPNARPPAEDERDPMLFQCSNRTGAFAVEAPIYDFSQADLDDADVFLLETHSNLFLWIGNQANKTEREGIVKLADEYAASRAEQMGAGAQPPDLVTVHSGAEPAIFTCHFPGWEAVGESGFVDPYEAKKLALLAENPSLAAESAPAAEDGANVFSKARNWFRGGKDMRV